MFKKERINIDYNIIKLQSFNQNILLRKNFLGAFASYKLIKRFMKMNSKHFRETSFQIRRVIFTTLDIFLKFIIFQITCQTLKVLMVLQLKLPSAQDLVLPVYCSLCSLGVSNLMLPVLFGKAFS